MSETNDLQTIVFSTLPVAKQSQISSLSFVAIGKNDLNQNVNIIATMSQVLSYINSGKIKISSSDNTFGYPYADDGHGGNAGKIRGRANNHVIVAPSQNGDYLEIYLDTEQLGGTTITNTASFLKVEGSDNSYTISEAESSRIFFSDSITSSAVHNDYVDKDTASTLAFNPFAGLNSVSGDNVTVATVSGNKVLQLGSSDCKPEVLCCSVTVNAELGNPAQLPADATIVNRSSLIHRVVLEVVVAGVTRTAVLFWDTDTSGFTISLPFAVKLNWENANTVDMKVTLRIADLELGEYLNFSEITTNVSVFSEKYYKEITNGSQV